MTFKIFFCLVVFTASAQNIKESVGFRENKGQIMDQNRKPNSLVKFLLNTKGLNVQIKKNGFSYEVYEPKKRPKEKRVDQNIDELAIPLKENKNSPSETLDYDCHRIDIDFVNPNPKATLIGEGKSDDYDNYYNVPNKPDGITMVHQYKKIIYKNIYPKIDVVFSIPDDRLKPVEYNFVIHPGGNMSDIQMKFSGAKTELIKNKIRIETRFGLMNETLPASWIEEKNNKNGITVGYRKIKDGIYGFNTKKVITNRTVVIDPIPERLWVFVYGLEDKDQHFTDMDSDKNGDIYFSGDTSGASSFYASSGAYKTILTGGEDGVIAKFDADGKRIWGTYFGGLEFDHVAGLAADSEGNIVITGSTSSVANISTSGAYKEYYLDNDGQSMGDAFVVKFNSSGIRLWGTYFGGSTYEGGYSIDTDKDNNIYIAGATSSADGIAVNSNFQNKFNGGWRDGFLSKFDPNGKITWSTYVGGEVYDYFGESIKCADDYLVVISRFSESRYLGTPGVFQENYYPKLYGEDLGDPLISKFALDGKRIWSTYYGGERASVLFDVEIDDNNNIYIVGGTKATKNMATTGSFKESYPAGFSSFLGKLDSSGMRVWGTYFSKNTEVNTIVFKNGYLYVSGNGGGDDTSITTPCAFKRAGANEGYLGKLNKNGELVFGTYTGKPSGYENGKASTSRLCFDKNNDIIIGGTAQKGLGDFEKSSFYFMKFHESMDKGFPKPESNSPVCLGKDIKLKASGGTSYLWTGPEGFTSTEQNPIIANATTENAGEYICTITADEGCVDTLTTTVFVGDKTPPIPDVVDLPVLNVNCSEQITTVPTATDGCSGLIMGTTVSSLFYSIPGTYTLVWKYDDGNGNSITQNQTLIIGAPQPIPTASSPQAFCIQQNVTLADIGVTGQNLKWYNQTVNGSLLNTATKLQDGGTYFATQTINGCESDRLPIQIEIPNAAPTGDANQSFCSTQDATIESIVVSGSNISWYASATQTTSLPSGTKLKDNTSYYATQTVRNCESIPRLAVKATFVNTLKANDYSQTVCGDFNDSYQTVDLSSYTPKLIDNVANYNFTYYGSLEGANNQIESDKITKVTDYQLTVGSHDIYVQILSDKGCGQIVKLNLNLVHKPIIPISDIVPICGNDSITIDAGSGNDIYKWSTSESSQTIAVSTPGNYLVDVSKNYGILSCTSSKNFTVVKSSSAIISKIEIDDWTDNKNALTILLEPGSIGDYEYSIDGIHFQDNNTFMDLSAGGYTVYIKDKNGCPTTKKEASVLMYPKYFTPNGDGYNDTWGIIGSNLNNKSAIRIFDRYGKLITEMGVNKTWDGTFGGIPLPATDYWFSINMENGKEIKGHFSLKR
ncbi:T9SS type B sorting domain-containing protein [Flavobacterium granuli]|uniref:Gliding motility-associated-like protein n=1 Tax=Flavobacterium granuli TaxID=280093 RepID=A0ABU1S117_9FLAO|nr:T9SS type B sorting domain-containing protein [Flavobacterium granuli]MDR6844723.1 gliding motility-associated-like protein [Flavobacterium granuli]